MNQAAWGAKIAGGLILEKDFGKRVFFQSLRDFWDTLLYVARRNISMKNCKGNPLPFHHSFSILCLQEITGAFVHRRYLEKENKEEQQNGSGSAGTFVENLPRLKGGGQTGLPGAGRGGGFWLSGAKRGGKDHHGKALKRDADSHSGKLPGCWGVIRPGSRKRFMPDLAS